MTPKNVLRRFSHLDAGPDPIIGWWCPSTPWTPSPKRATTLFEVNMDVKMHATFWCFESLNIPISVCFYPFWIVSDISWLGPNLGDSCCVYFQLPTVVTEIPTFFVFNSRFVSWTPMLAAQNCQFSHICFQNFPNTSRHPIAWTKGSVAAKWAKNSSKPRGGGVRSKLLWASSWGDRGPRPERSWAKRRQTSTKRGWNRRGLW